MVIAVQAADVIALAIKAWIGTVKQMNVDFRTHSGTPVSGVTRFERRSARWARCGVAQCACITEPARITRPPRDVLRAHPCAPRASARAACGPASRPARELRARSPDRRACRPAHT